MRERVSRLLSSTLAVAARRSTAERLTIRDFWGGREYTVRRTPRPSVRPASRAGLAARHDLAA